MAASTRPTFLRHSALGFGPLARNLDADVTRSWMEPLRTDPASARDTARFMAGIDKADLLDVSTRLAAFARPVRLVWGDADRFFKVDFAHRLAETFPSAELTTVAGGLTFLPLDAPDAVAEAISAVGVPGPKHLKIDLAPADETDGVFGRRPGWSGKARSRCARSRCRA